jgi:hypothetical protein
MCKKRVGIYITCTQYIHTFLVAFCRISLVMPLHALSNLPVGSLMGLEVRLAYFAFIFPCFFPDFRAIYVVLLLKLHLPYLRWKWKLWYYFVSVILVWRPLVFLFDFVLKIPVTLKCSSVTSRTTSFVPSYLAYLRTSRLSYASFCLFKGGLLKLIILLIWRRETLMDRMKTLRITFCKAWYIVMIIVQWYCYLFG